MDTILAAEVTVNKSLPVIRQTLKDANGAVRVEDIPFTHELRKSENIQRTTVQKALFDVALNLDLGPQGKNLPPDILRGIRSKVEEADYVDNFDGVYNGFQILQPPVDPKTLVHISQRVPIIGPIVDSMKINIEGHGVTFASILDLENPAVRAELREHFQNKEVERFIQDGEHRLRELRQTDGQTTINKRLTPWDNIIEETLEEAVPILKYRALANDEELHVALKAWRADAPRVYELGDEKIQKIRERTFLQRLAALNTRKRAEEIFLKNFFANCNAKLSWMQLRKMMRDDFERVGAWAKEVVRDPGTRIPELINHVPVVDVRMTKLCSPIKAPIFHRLNMVELVEKEAIVQYRKFVQCRGRTGQYSWFKEFGDPRIMDRRTGKYVGQYELSQKSGKMERVFFHEESGKLYRMTEAEYLANVDQHFDEATELLYHSLYNAIGSPYPVPRWFGCLTLTQGMIAMEDVNASWFDNDTVPPMIVKVADGVLSKKSERRINAIFESRRGREKHHSVVVLEAEPRDRARNFANTKGATIEIERLRDVIQNDATHTNYDEKGRVKIRGSWRIPPYLVGQESQYTRQSINASKVAAEEQVFQPERSETDDVMNKTLLPAMGICHWLYKSNTPPVADNLQMAQVLSILGKAGFLSVGEARPEVEMILNRQLTKFSDQSLENTPFPLILIEAKAKAGTNVNPATGSPRGKPDLEVEKPQNKMGARPDKEGFTTDSAVVKSYLEKDVGLAVAEVYEAKFEEADGMLADLIKASGSAFLLDEDSALYFVTRGPGGQIMHFRKEEWRAA